MNNKTFWAMKRREMERRAANQDRPARRSGARRARPEDRAPGEERTYRELQAEAKELGIPANQSRDELEAAVTEAESASDVATTLTVEDEGSTEAAAGTEARGTANE